VRRGDIVTVAVSGDYGKPRPAVVVQSDMLEGADSVLVCLVTSTLRDTPFFRLDVMPGPGSGPRAPSQVMVDKIVAVRRDRCGPAIGRLDAAGTAALNRLLALVIGLADPAPRSGN